MLIENQKYSEGDIIAFKLVTGEEIVAKLIEERDIEYRVDRPYSLVAGPQGLGLAPSLMSVDPKSTINIKKEHVLMSGPVIDQMRTGYIQTTTGIQPVPKGGIIT